MSKNCKSDQIINPRTGRCVKRTGKIGKQILSESKNNVESKSKTSYDKKSKSKWESDQIINPRTGRCVKKTGKIGKQILSESKNKVESKSKTYYDKKSKSKNNVESKSKSECVRQHTSKYIKRKSPPFPANKCKNQYRAGNDGLLWFSKANKKGVHRWVPITSLEGFYLD